MLFRPNILDIILQFNNKIESNWNIINHKCEILKFYFKRENDDIKVLSKAEIEVLKIEFENLEYYDWIYLMVIVVMKIQ